MKEEVCANPDNLSPTMARLESQIEWYSRQSTHAKRVYIVLRSLVIVLAGAIPAIHGLGFPQILPGILGALILIFEGIQQLLQSHRNWFVYRTTSELLKREKYLFIAGASPYNAPSTRIAFLAERIEAIMAREHFVWMAAQTQSRDERSQPHGASQ